MKSFQSPAAVPCFHKTARQYPSGPWEMLDGSCKAEQKQQLLNNQNFLCAWCQTQIDTGSSHLDHIRSRHNFPKLTFKITNLVVSCQSTRSCGHGRAETGELPNWIHPYDNPDLEQEFDYRPDGSINPKSDDPRQRQEAENALNVQFNLNCPRLKERRETHITYLNSYTDQDFTVDEVISFLPDFPSITQQLFS